MKIHDIMTLSPVIPVITLKRVEDALPLAEALIEGGLRVLEITLRTPAALDSIKAMRARFPDAVIGAGTVINRDTWQQAVDAGAQFIVSPGTTPALLETAAGQAVPLLPGASTASEVMNLLEHGIDAMKFFPAEAAGGIAMLKSLASPLGQVRFCPTGGIDYDKARDYLALPNVSCVGGSWMVRSDWIEAGRWQDIAAAAGQAAGLKNA